MTASTIETAGHGEAHGAEEPSYLAAKKGLMSWIFTVDHKRIGVMYLASIGLFFLIG